MSLLCLKLSMVPTLLRVYTKIQSRGGDLFHPVISSCSSYFSYIDLLLVFNWAKLVLGSRPLYLLTILHGQYFSPGNPQDLSLYFTQVCYLNISLSQRYSLSTPLKTASPSAPSLSPYSLLGIYLPVICSIRERTRVFCSLLHSQC